MIVVKLGGSLYSSAYLKEWIDALVTIEHQKIIIVPGGGPFANVVRTAYEDWHIDEQSSHDMAILAMQQYGILISSLNEQTVLINSVDLLEDNLKLKKVMIWLPNKDVSERCSYDSSWEVTSDSLSAWLANTVDAKKLCLIKSAKITNSDIDELISLDIVDPYFSKAVNNFRGEVSFYSADQLNNFISDINNEVS